MQPRDDLRALDGYHSPQVDVAVRLNTNESPYAPPPEFVDAVRRRARATSTWNRYPDRGARELRDALGAFLGQPRERLLCAQRQQRGAADAAAHLRRRRAAGR